MDLSIAGLWGSMGAPARVIAVLMVFMLICCIYVAIERLMVFTRSRAQSRELAAAISKPLGSADIEGALKLLGAPTYKDAYLGAILKAGLNELKTRMDGHGIEASERAIERTLITETANLRKGMNILATTGSTTPFVGLVGTILGIITAFGKMAEAGGGDLTAVSGGIAEALVSTAVGIIVAIIGVWMYNFFNATIDDITKDMTTSSQELLDWAKKEVLRRSEAAAAK